MYSVDLRRWYVRAAVVLHNFLRQTNGAALVEFLIHMTVLDSWKKDNGDGLGLKVEEPVLLSICQLLEIRPIQNSCGG